MDTNTAEKLNFKELDADVLRLATAKETRSKEQKNYETISIRDIFELATSPNKVSSVSAKAHQIPAFIPSTYVGSDGRDKHIQIDKGSFPILVFDVDTGNIKLKEVKKVFSEVFGEDALTLIYSTRSATELQKRWRILIPVSEPLKGKLIESAQKLLINLLAAELDKCTASANQIAFLPVQVDGGFYSYDISGSVIYNSAEIIRLAKAENARLEVIAANNQQTKSTLDPESYISLFNNYVEVETLLEKYGYKYGGKKRDSRTGEIKSEWRSPKQRSNSYATAVYESGKFSTKSDSDISEGIGVDGGDVNWGGAYDLFKFYECDNDDEKAREAVKSFEVETANGELKPLKEVRSDLILVDDPDDTEDGMAQRDDEKALEKARSLFAFEDWDEGDEAPDWIIDGFIPEGLCSFVAYSGRGKTSVLVPICAAAAGLLDSPLSGEVPRKVIYVSEDLKQVKTILRGLNRHYVKDFYLIKDRIKLVHSSRFPADKYKALAQIALENCLEVDGYIVEPLVVFDTTNATIDVGDENSAAEVGKVVAAFKSFFVRRNIPLWLVSHTTKAGADNNDGDQRGSGAWRADIEAAYVIAEDSIDPTVRYVLNKKNRQSISVDEVAIKFTGEVRTTLGMTKRGKEREMNYLKAELGWASKDEIASVNSSSKKVDHSERDLEFASILNAAKMNAQSEDGTFKRSDINKVIEANGAEERLTTKIVDNLLQRFKDQRMIENMGKGKGSKYKLKGELPF